MARSRNWNLVIKDDKELDEAFEGSYRFREALKKVLDALEEKTELIDDYEIPNWQLLQAEANGKRKLIKTLKTYLEN